MPPATFRYERHGVEWARGCVWHLDVSTHIVYYMLSQAKEGLEIYRKLQARFSEAWKQSRGGAEV